MKRILSITSTEFGFMVKDKFATGSPTVGYGRTMTEAMGSWLRRFQDDLGIEFSLDDEATQRAEERRRDRELAKR